VAGRPAQYVLLRVQLLAFAMTNDILITES